MGCNAMLLYGIYGQVYSLVIKERVWLWLSTEKPRQET
jgi:hypothetical protein